MNIKCAAKLGFKKVSHVIFDLDGLLLDTEKAYTRAAQNVLDQYGKTYSPDLKRKMLGLQGADVAKAIVDFFKLPLPWDQFYALVKQEYPVCTFADTETIYKRVINEVAKRYGKEYTAAVRAQVLGRTEDDGARVAVNEMQLPMTPQEFVNEYKTLATKCLPGVGIMPGAERLVRHFHSNRIPIAVATSSGLDSYEVKASKHKALFSLFSHVVTGGTDPEVKQGKPAPDIFLVCASRFTDKPKPDKCLVFEDAPNGVEAARAAGMQVVMVPDKELGANMGKDATLKLNSLEEMRPELFGLPPFK